MKEQWRQQMQQKMADYRQSAPKVSWDALNKALANNKPKAKIVPMWMRRIAAAVAILLVSTLGYLALNREELSRGDGFDPVSSANGITQNRPPSGENESQHSSLQEDSSLMGAAKAPILAVVTPKKQSHQKKEQTIEPQPTQTVEPQEESSTPQPQDSQPQETQEPQDTHHTQTIVETPQRQTLDYPTEIRPKTTADSRLTAKVYLMSNGLKDSYIDRPEYTVLKGELNGGKFSNTGQTTGITYQNKKPYPNATLYDKNHHQPIRLGLSLRYRLNDKWSVESGLTYTLHRSDINWSIINDLANTEQTLSYVGIPVNANYLLWRSRYVNFYVSAGGMIEKMVEGRWNTIYRGSIQKEYVSIHPLQFSVNGGIGAEFNLTNQFSIYAEPGMGYYFDNGSDIPTYYQDTPFSFNLNIGIRFHIK